MPKKMNKQKIQNNSFQTPNTRQHSTVIPERGKHMKWAQLLEESFLAQDRESLGDRLMRPYAQDRVPEPRAAQRSLSSGQVNTAREETKLKEGETIPRAHCS